MYKALLWMFMKTDVYLPLLRVTGIFNMTGNVNLQDLLASITIFSTSDFKNLVISLISNKIFSRSVRDLATVGDPSV